MTAPAKINGKEVTWKELVFIVSMVLFPFMVFFIWVSMTLNYIRHELGLVDTGDLPNYIFYGGLIILFVTVECMVLMGIWLEKRKKL